MAKKASPQAVVDPKPALARFFLLTCSVAALLLAVVCLFGLATPNAKTGAISLPLFCFTHLAAACISAFEVIASYLAPTKKIARLAHAILCLILCYVAAGILYALSILRLDLTSVFGIVAVFFIFLVLYGVFFFLHLGVAKLTAILPARIAPQKSIKRAFYLFQGISFLFLCYAAILAHLRQSSDIGLHLAQYALLFVFSLCYTVLDCLLQNKNTALRLLCLWAVTLLGFTFAILLTDVNGILPLSNLADRFVAYVIISLLFWMISLITYGIKRAISVKQSKKTPTDSKKSSYEKLF